MGKRRGKIPAPSWEHQQGELGRRLQANRWQLLATGAVVALVIVALGVVAFGFLTDFIEDQQRPGSLGLRVADRELTVSDYTRRAERFVEQSGSNQANIVLQTLNSQLIEEGILLAAAEEEGVSASEEDVTAELANMLGIATDDPNFDARVEEEFESSGLGEEHYREIARAAVLRDALIDKFTEEVPETLPSVHYRQIQVESQAIADDIVQQLEDGADFATLAAEHSLDQSAAENGGDQGFVPEGFLDDVQEGVLFDMEPDEITTYPTANSVFVFEMLEKSDIQEPTEEQRDRLAVNAYQDWLEEKREELDFRNEFDLQEGDADKIRYVIDHAELTIS